MPKHKGPRRKAEGKELKMLRVSSVAIVDDPANNKSFAVIKRRKKAAAKGATMGKAKGKAATQTKKAGVAAIVKNAIVLDGEAVEGVMEAASSVTETLTSLNEFLSNATPDEATGLVLIPETAVEGFEELNAQIGSIMSTLQMSPDASEAATAEAEDAEMSVEGGEVTMAKDKGQKKKTEEKSEGLSDEVLEHLTKHVAEVAAAAAGETIKELLPKLLPQKKSASKYIDHVDDDDDDDFSDDALDYVQIADQDD